VNLVGSRPEAEDVWLTDGQRDGLISGALALVAELEARADACDAAGLPRWASRHRRYAESYRAYADDLEAERDADFE